MTAETEVDAVRTRVLIADDHPLYRSGLRGALGADPRFEVVGEVGTGTDAIAASHRLRPHVVLMDIAVPGIDGISATKAIAGKCQGTDVVILTVLEDSETFLPAMRAGARGYLLKGSGVDDIARAVGTVRRGGVAFGPVVSEWVIDHLKDTHTDGGKPFPELTDRERAVLELIADGRGNDAIAYDLDVSVKTVRNYVSRIFAKLRIVERGEAAMYARRAGLGS
ncbi:response regulator [Kibdelosporangium phytohabitans]|uniref:response regulator n=1 Tax=Kibdelosporangium phytohabitans TaxID=860235 RepID=UPI0012F86B27|nr:response regulator transcription factor [Kibdelosporangium phytohabitans]MBE1470192.1 DNA-binding NarL/FixJ family response regulator [Kibdelosporangium phytohabitans]